MYENGLALKGYTVTPGLNLQLLQGIAPLWLLDTEAIMN